MHRRGFTIVELVITITIMGILLTLAVVNVNSSQLRSRDDERKADVESIAAAMESFYAVGGNTSTGVGRYVSTVVAGSTDSIISNLRDVDLKSFSAPGVDDPAETFVAATNNNQVVGGVAPQPTFGQYVYQPLTGTGALCTNEATECRKFNLFYRLEADNTVYKVTSRNQ